MAEVCLGKYLLRGELGRGAMGVVYRAYDTVLEREVALKTMALASGKDAGEETLRFLREARAAGRLHHPNIVTIHELGEEQGQPFIAMELMEGTDLGRLIASGSLPPIDRRLQIVAQICDGLDFAHRAGIVHRDIKPANIFLLDSGAVKILDFGVAKLAASEATRTGTVLGTVDYMSPEQVRAERDLDGRSDLFAAGVILYELLFGRRPFSGDHVGVTLHRILNEPPLGFDRIAPVLPPRLARLIERALAKRREDRFPTAAAMKRELDAVGNELSGRAGEELAARLREVCGAADLFEPRPPGTASAETEIDTRGAAPAPPRAVRWRRWAAGISLSLLAIAAALYLADRRVSAPPVPLAVPRHPPHPAAPPERTETARPPASGAAEPRAREAATPATVRAELPARAPREPPPAAARKRPRSGTPPGAAGKRHGRWVPPDAHPAPAVRPGSLSLRIAPWARVLSIERIGDGRRFPAGQIAPVRLTLPPGRYRVALTHPSTVDPLLLEVEVAPGRTTVVTRPIGVEGLAGWIEQRIGEEGVVLEER